MTDAKYRGIKAKKHMFDGYKFDSAQELNFYQRFIKGKGYRFDIHKSFKVMDKFPLGGMNQRGVGYSPDFIIYDESGGIKHVYEVKASFSEKSSITSSVKLHIKLFEKKYNIPVQIVVVRKKDFRMRILGLTTKFEERCFKNIDYSVWDLIGR